MIVGIINPAHRQATAIEYALLDACREAGLSAPTVLFTSVGQPGETQAERAVHAGADRVVVAGGDGTVRHVASGLVGTDVPLAIVPTGTANLFALNLGSRPRRRGDREGLQRDLRRAVQGTASEHDVGVARWMTADQQRHESVFLAAAGLGMDAATIEATSRDLKTRLGWWAYLAEGVRNVRRAPATFSVGIDGAPPQELPAWSVLLGNVPSIPAGITVFPQAGTTSGTLQLLRTAPTRPVDWVGIAVNGLRRRPGRCAALHYRTVHTATVTPQVPTPLQLDGDSVGPVIGAQFTVRPRDLLVVAHGEQIPHPSPGPPPSPPRKESP